jgi:ubiquinone/menaquinone biosynthesis C-methylase UbiE
LITGNKSSIQQSSPFDYVAEDYDVAFSQSPIGQLQRNRVHILLEASLAGSAPQILEINCGTGDDAIWLAERGYQVTATDVSEMMIDKLKDKISNHSPASQIEVKQVSIEKIREQFVPASFDLIFSDFGGLNCLPKNALQEFIKDAAFLLKPGGKIVAVVMGRKCLWERVYFLLKGKKTAAFRRNSEQPLKVMLGDHVQNTWYYSPDEIRNISSIQFKLIRLKPVGIAIPPSYLNPFFYRKKKLLALLNNMEAMLSFSFLSNYADHFYIELQKIK